MTGLYFADWSVNYQSTGNLTAGISFAARPLSISISRYLQIQRAKISLIQTLLDFIRSIRNGDWDLHIYISEKMLYWFHAYDNYNYGRHFSHY